MSVVAAAAAANTHRSDVYYHNATIKKMRIVNATAILSPVIMEAPATNQAEYRQKRKYMYFFVDD